MNFNPDNQVLLRQGGERKEQERTQRRQELPEGTRRARAGERPANSQEDIRDNKNSPTSTLGCGNGDYTGRMLRSQTFAPLWLSEKDAQP